MFCLWPPTEQNLETLDREASGGLRLSDRYAGLEGGLRVALGEHDALRMKSGTIHDVRTHVGGFIVTKRHIDESTVVPTSRWLARSPSYLKRLDGKGRDLALGNWIDAARLAVSEDVARSWRFVG